MWARKIDLMVGNWSKGQMRFIALSQCKKKFFITKIVFMFLSYEKTVNNVLPRNASVFSPTINIFARRPD